MNFNFFPQMRFDYSRITICNIQMALLTYVHESRTFTSNLGWIYEQMSFVSCHHGVRHEDGIERNVRATKIEQPFRFKILCSTPYYSRCGIINLQATSSKAAITTASA